jgi:hypothetical protein
MLTVVLLILTIIALLWILSSMGILNQKSVALEHLIQSKNKSADIYITKHVYDIIHRVAREANIPEEKFADRLPAVYVAETTAYQNVENQIFLKEEDVSDDPKIGEEVGHYLRSMCNPEGDTVKTSEFFGGLGRLVMGAKKIRLSNEEVSQYHEVEKYENLIKQKIANLEQEALELLGRPSHEISKEEFARLPEDTRDRVRKLDQELGALGVEWGGCIGAKKTIRGHEQGYIAAEHAYQQNALKKDPDLFLKPRNEAEKIVDSYLTEKE